MAKALLSGGRDCGFESRPDRFPFSDKIVFFFPLSSKNPRYQRHNTLWLGFSFLKPLLYLRL